MNKQTVHVKSNGLRNEMKEIRKSIDKLTNALIEIHIAQTNKPYENDVKPCTCSNTDRVRNNEPKQTG
jgi:hypothetical protein